MDTQTTRRHGAALLRRWWLKAAAQGLVSRLPGGVRWNRVMQRSVTRSLRLTDRSATSKWRKALRHHAIWMERRASAPEVALELGTGWHPVVPVTLAVLGVSEVLTCDIASLLSASTVRETLGAVRERFEADPTACATLDEGRMATLRSLMEGPPRDPATVLSALGITALTGDATRTALPDGSVDLFVSNNTLEHLPPAVLSGVLEEHRRLARPEALASHHVDLKDHYAGFDPRIGVYHFLRFSDRAWRLFDNPLHRQNRLRVSDYRRCLERAGWRVVMQEDESDPEAFARARLAPRFRAYPAAECMVHTSWLVGERAT